MCLGGDRAGKLSGLEPGEEMTCVLLGPCPEGCDWIRCNLCGSIADVEMWEFPPYKVMMADGSCIWRGRVEEFGVDRDNPNLLSPHELRIIREEK